MRLTRGQIKKPKADLPSFAEDCTATTSSVNAGVHGKTNLGAAETFKLINLSRTCRKRWIYYPAKRVFKD